MVAFLIFIALLIIAIVGGVCFNLSLYARGAMKSVRRLRTVTLRQEAMLGSVARKHVNAHNTGQLECAARVAGVVLALLVVLILIVVIFIESIN